MPERHNRLRFKRLRLKPLPLKRLLLKGLPRIGKVMLAGAAFALPAWPGAAVTALAAVPRTAHVGAGVLIETATTRVPTPVADAQSPVPDWARERWETLAKARSLQVSQHAKPGTLTGDFDGDGKSDVAVLVETLKTHKIGIVFIHHNTTLPRVAGAGTDFGNGGDNFDWMDSWKVQPRTKARPTDAVLVERESSASGLIYFANGKYHWKQVGD